ncbi:MAG: hypothetical protein JWM93_79 [Frankiales bacterium]|nr:hypothetical protein [Frankiales bacterium]
MAASDLLADAVWQCASTPAGHVGDPAALPHDLDWLPAQVAGTVAGALLAAGEWQHGDPRDLDADDWWFRCTVATADDAGGSWRLTAGGIATLADVWLDGVHVLSSQSMFVAHDVEVGDPRPGAELVVRCRSLRQALDGRFPRPRWKTRLVSAQSMRWFRTSLLGRMPGWGEVAAAVGPYRPLTLTRAPAVSVGDVRLTAGVAGDSGTVTVAATLTSRSRPRSVELVVGDVRAPLAVDGDTITGSLTVDDVRRWWPRGYGDQPLYDVSLHIDGEARALGRVGFRSLAVDRAGGAFRVSVNGVDIFCRGACWAPVDPVSMAPTAAQQRAAVQQVAAAGMNMIRIPGTMTYEDATFWDLCDELGLLVWQDVMCADMDYPDDPAFVAVVGRELTQLFASLQGRPSIAVVSGGSETEQQATMLGLPPERRTGLLATTSIPALVADWLPGVAYVVSSPTGGALAIRSDTGVAHYFGVGGYRRPLSDARTAGVRFAAECLAFATPPEKGTVDAVFGGARALGTATWKAAVPRDNGATWDFEDVRDHYVRELFGEDPAAVAARDPERALDLGRAAVCELMAGVFSEWRRAASPCAGGLVLSLRDLRPGAGVGIVDALGVPKAPYHSLARVFAPVALLAVDEGLNGLRLHVCNDGPSPLRGRLVVTLFSAAGTVTESAERAVEVPPHTSSELDAEDVLGGFRDVTWAYRFGPPATDVVGAVLLSDTGEELARTTHFALGPRRDVADIGLTAHLAGDSGGWTVTVSTRLAAQYVAVDFPGFTPADSWFHLPPGGRTAIPLAPRSAGGDAVPRGTVRALNAARTVAVRATG